MYMFRAYQSPSPTADCGPQCDQIPNFASENHPGIWNVLSESIVPAKGPGVSASPLSGACRQAPRAANAVADVPNRMSVCRLVSFMDLVYSLSGICMESYARERRVVPIFSVTTASSPDSWNFRPGTAALSSLFFNAHEKVIAAGPFR